MTIIGGVHLILKDLLTNNLAINTLSLIGTFCSIIGLVFTVYIFLNTKSIKEKYNLLSQSKQLKKDRNTLVKDFKSCNDLLSKEDSREYGIIDLARILRQLDDYSLSMVKKDKHNIKKLRKFVIKGEISVTEAQVAIHEIIGFLQSNHDKTSDLL